MLFHCIGLLPWNVLGTPLAVFSVGWIGVDVFFVISGYVITGSAARHINLPCGRQLFWRSRLARILPLYYITSVVYLAMVSSEALQNDAGNQIFSHLLLVHSFFQSTALSINGVTWSLGLEMQFYLLAFLLVPLAAHARRTTLVTAYVFLLGAVIAYRLTAWLWLRDAGSTDVTINHALSQFPGLFDSFAIGGLIRLLGPRRFSSAQGLSLTLLAFVLLVLIYVIYETHAAHYWSSLFMAVFFRSLIAAFAAVALLAALALRASAAWWPMLRLGKISYGIYLWHLIVLFLVQRHLPVRGAAAVLTIVAITILLAELSQRAIEQPCMRWAHTPLGKK